LIYTLLNAAKPLHIDDTEYYYVARQISQRPLDPYDFEVFWYDIPQKATSVLAPPVVPYWRALALRLFGDQPVVWKVWLFPFCLLFVCSLYWLFRRFASGLEIPLVCLTFFSAAFLASLNLMLDVPALALSLGALGVFFRACERRCVGLAMAAGLLAGLAMQTKYTSFIAPAVMLVYA